MGYRNLGVKPCALCGARVIVSPRRGSGKPPSCPRDAIIGQGLVEMGVVLHRAAEGQREALARAPGTLA